MSFSGLSIIIPTKDRGHVFYKTLEAAFVATADIPSEIIVINDSKTQSVTLDKKYTDKIKVLTNPKSGVASARNLGAKEAKFDTFLFLDDDILISKENIHALIENSKLFQNAIFNFNWEYPKELTEKIDKTQFGRYLIQNGFTSLKGWNTNLTWNDSEIFKLDLIASYFLFISKQQFNLVGTYNESFPHAGAEDFDFAMRLKKSGMMTLCNPLSIVWHNEEDRVELLSWLQRKERAAETRKIAVGLGYDEMRIQASSLKINLVTFLYPLKNTLLFLLASIPNVKAFDRIYFKLTNTLLAIYLYKGYFKK